MDFIDVVKELKDITGSVDTNSAFLKTILECLLEDYLDKEGFEFEGVISLKEDTLAKYMSKNLSINTTLKRINNYVNPEGIKRYLEDNYNYENFKKKLVEVFCEIDGITENNAIEKFSIYLVDLIGQNITSGTKNRRINKRDIDSESNKNTIEKIHELSRQLKAPIKLGVPQNIEGIEDIYINELYKAYGDAENIKGFNNDSLKDYPEYEEDFKERRIEFYAAETVNRGFKEISDDFNVLKEEIFKGTKDIARKKYNNGYEKMLEVVSFSTTLQLVEYPYVDKNWINFEIRKGVCQHLVNDKKLKWVVDE